MGLVIGLCGGATGVKARKQQRNIVLASSSPRRKEILAITGLKFLVDVSDFEEDMSGAPEPRELARRLSREKAFLIAHRHHDALIIAADTFILFEGRILGKPHTSEAAAQMLRALSGRTHLVITGFTILDTAGGKCVSDSVETKVYFRSLTEEEIDSYVMSGEPLDKAGAYAIQGLGALLIRGIEGDYFNVVGLPLSALAARLKEFGIHIL